MLNPWAGLNNLNKNAIISLQNQKLYSFINTYLYPFSQQYRKVFDQKNINPKKIKTLDDLKQIPLTSKLDLISSDANPDAYKSFILRPDKELIKKYWPKAKLLGLAYESLAKGKDEVEYNLETEFRPVFITFTTGTTNKPVPFLYSNYDVKNLHVSGARMLNLFDITRSENLINMFPFAPHLAFWQVAFGGLASNALVLSTGGGKVMSTEGNITAIMRMRPTVILGVPTYIYHVLREAREKGIKMDFVKKVVVGAAKVTTAFKMKIAESLEAMGAKDVKVFGTYGFTEARCAWAECPTSLDVSSGYHLYPDKEIFEIIDPKTGEVKKEGEDGELVYTSIDSRASVMLRYRTGDFVKGGITYEPCPHCKRTVPRISSDITRLSDVKDLQLSKVKGMLVNLNHFADILSSIPDIDDWQLEIRKKNNDPYEIDEVVVYLCVQKVVNKTDFAEMVKRQIMDATEVAPNLVQFIDRPEMVKRLEIETANKEKRILDSRPKI